MRRPKQPDDSPDQKPPPGGHARKRLEQFNRQRGLPTDTDTPPDEAGGDAQKPAEDSGKKRSED
jgi:hypothetical protein